MQPHEAHSILLFLYDDDAPMEIYCHANQEQLSAYIDAELSHLSVATLYPALHSQVTTCESCKVVYEELKALLTMERMGNLASPSAPAIFDLSYLAQTPEVEANAGGAVRAERVIDHIIWRLGEWGQLSATFSADFIQSLRPAELQPSFLKASAGDLFVVSSPDITNDLSVTITAREKRRDAERCTLIVNADIPSRDGWPNLGGTAVTLRVGERELEQLYSNAFGNVVFDDIARADLAQLSLTVQPS